MKPQEILKEARDKSGETQEVIAGKIGVSLRMYQRYEEGKFPKYRSDSIEKLDKLFGTHIYGMLYDKMVRKVPQPEPDPATVILPTGNVKKTLADYINLLEYYNRTLSNAINSGLVDIKDSLKKAESNLSQGQKNIEKQLLHSTENLGELMAKHNSDLMENTSLKKGSGLGRRKARDGDGERKGHL